jgi:hypothetical protein
MILGRREARAAAQRVDRLEATGGDEPRARVRGHAVLRPLLECRAERVVQRFLGDVEVAEQPNERGEHATRLVLADRLDGGPRGRRVRSGHDLVQAAMEKR